VIPDNTLKRLRKLVLDELKQWTRDLDEPFRIRFACHIEACVVFLLTAQGSAINEPQVVATERIVRLIGELREQIVVSIRNHPAAGRPKMSIEELSQHVARVGSQSGLARTIGVAPGVVNQWINGRAPISPKHIEAIRKAPPEPRHARMTFAGKQALFKRLTTRFIRSAGGLEKAAELLGLETRTLLRYWSGASPVPPEIEIAMRNVAEAEEPASRDVPHRPPQTPFATS